MQRGGRTGDACDLSPVTKNGNAARGDAEQFNDLDGDWGGDVSDNCLEKKNDATACTSNADCSGYACVGTGFKRCSATGAVCLSGAQCPAGECLEGPGGSTFGRCSRQLDDPDGNGVGGACDLCPGLANQKIMVSSNLDAEIRKQVQIMGDQCDPVPQLVLRANVGRVLSTAPNEPLIPLGSTASYTMFAASMGLGSGASPAQTNGLVVPRYCDCYDPNRGELLSKTECMTSRCEVRDDSYYDQSGRFNRIRTSVAADGTMPSSNPVLGQSIGASYSGALSEDTFAHPGTTETWRLGSRKMVRWFHAEDIASGTAYELNGRTAGLLLAHVTSQTVSARDLATPALRDTVEYVTTPLVQQVAPNATRVFTDCLFSGCNMIWRPDWYILPPDTYRVDPSPLEMVTSYARLVEQSDGTFALLGRPNDPTFDVAPSLSSTAAYYTRIGASLLTPVEAGGSVRARGWQGFGTIAVTPAEWRSAWDHPRHARHGQRRHRRARLQYAGRGAAERRTSLWRAAVRARRS